MLLPLRAEGRGDDKKGGKGWQTTQAFQTGGGEWGPGAATVSATASMPGKATGLGPALSWRCGALYQVARPFSPKVKHISMHTQETYTVCDSEPKARSSNVCLLLKQRSWKGKEEHVAVALPWEHVQPLR